MGLPVGLSSPLGNMRPEPPNKRAVSFFDGQNLFHHAKAAFGHHHPNYDPINLTAAIAYEEGWTTEQVRFYTGVPDVNHDRRWHAYWTRRLAAMKRRRVEVTRHRRNRYRDPGHIPIKRTLDQGRLRVPRQRHRLLPPRHQRHRLDTHLANPVRRLPRSSRLSADGLVVPCISRGCSSQRAAEKLGTDMAEGQGFEPWEGRPSLVFKTSAFVRSATPPGYPSRPAYSNAPSSKPSGCVRCQRHRSTQMRSRS